MGETGRYQRTGGVSVYANLKVCDVTGHCCRWRDIGQRCLDLLVIMVFGQDGDTIQMVRMEPAGMNKKGSGDLSINCSDASL